LDRRKRRAGKILLVQIGGNPETTIEYQLPVSSHEEISVFNLIGQELITLVEENHQAGYYSTSWNSLDEKGRVMSAGNYLVRMKAEGFLQSRKVTVLR